MKRFKSLLSTLLLVSLFLASPAVLPDRSVQAQIDIGGAITNWAEDRIADGFTAVMDGATNQEGFFIRGMNIVAQYGAKTIVGHIPGVTIAYNANPEYVRVSQQTSMVGLTAQTVPMFYQAPPASTYAFLLDTGQSLGFVPKKAYAQGIGFAGMAPLLPLWKAFRNIAYFIMAIIMVVIGFMVMFRKKIDPRTVVTVQNALPRIVITLILITFSYAIVGIAIDIMYLLILLILNILSPMLPNASSLANDFTNGNFLSLLGRVFGTGIQAGIAAVGGTGGVFGALGVGAVVGAIIGAIVSLFIATLSTGGGALVGVVIGAIIVIILFAIVLLFALFRIFFMLLMAYVNIVVALIFGPIQIMMDAVPGGNGFNGWIRNLLANILVFPATALMFALAGVILNISGTTNLWAPPLLSVPLIANNPGAGIPGLLALGLLLLTPTLANAIKDALKPPEFKYAGAPAAALGAVFGFPISFGTGMAQTAFTSAMYARINRAPTHTIQDSAKPTGKH